MPPRPRLDLHALRTEAQRFGRAFPSIAPALGRALPEPVTERLIDGVGYLASALLERIEHFQGAAYDALAERAAPWLRRPTPAATIVAFDAPSGARSISPDTVLEGPRVEGVRCAFRLTGPLILEPYEIAGAELETAAGRSPRLRVTIRSTGTESLTQPLSRGLTLFVGGELESALYLVHAMTRHLESVAIDVGRGQLIPLEKTNVERAGLRLEDSLTPDPDGLPAAFGIVTDSILCPDAFRFVRISGLEELAAIESTRTLTFVFTLRDLAGAVVPGRRDLRTHCALVRNLFEAWADPIPLDPLRGAVPVRMAGLPRSASGAYLVLEARARAGGDGPDIVLPDLRRLAAAHGDADASACFATTFEATADGRSEMHIRFTLRKPAGLEAPHVVSLHLLATNGHVAARLREGDLACQVEVEGAALGVRNIVAASPYVPPPTGNAFALMATRYAALRDGAGDPLAALKRALYLAVPSLPQAPETARAAHLRIEALRSLEVSVGRRVEPRGGIRRGYAYRLSVDEAGFRGPGDLGLFGATLAEALSRAVPVNTFAELTVVGHRGGTSVTFGARQPA